MWLVYRKGISQDVLRTNLQNSQYALLLTFDCELYGFSFYPKDVEGRVLKYALKFSVSHKLMCCLRLRIKEFEKTLLPLYRKEKFTAVTCQSYCYLRLCILTTHKFLQFCSALIFLSMIHIICTLAIFNTVQ